MGGLTKPHQPFKSTAQEMAVTLLMLIISLTVPMGVAAVAPPPLCTSLTKSPKQLLTLKQGLFGSSWLIYNPTGYGGHPLKKTTVSWPMRLFGQNSNTKDEWIELRNQEVQVCLTFLHIKIVGKKGTFIAEFGDVKGQV